MFEPSLVNNAARFAYVPEFHESSLGNGNSWLHILRFRAVYLQTTLWKKGNNYILHSPGDEDGSGATCYHPTDDMWIVCPTNLNGSLIQLTAVIIPDNALPTEIRGDYTTPGSTVNPFTTELFK